MGWFGQFYPQIMLLIPNGPKVFWKWYNTVAQPYHIRGYEGYNTCAIRHLWDNIIIYISLVPSAITVHTPFSYWESYLT